MDRFTALPSSMFYIAFRRACNVFTIALLFVTTTILAEEPHPKLSVPEEDAQAAKVALIREVYEQDYAQADRGDEKVRFAKKLYSVGLETKNDPVGRYVLFRIARDIATEQGDLSTAIAAVEAIDQSYDVDLLQMKGEVLTSVAATARTNAEHLSLGETTLTVVDQAIQLDRYAFAEPLAENGTWIPIDY